MQLDIFDSPELQARSAANTILDLVDKKPNAVLCMASGETPKLTNQYLAEGAKQNGIDFSKVQFVSLDEWVGIQRSNTGSCYYFLDETFFKPLSIPPTNIHFFDGTATDLAEECRKIDNAIQLMGGLDFVLLGIGLNGHLGFNEPGVSPHLLAHVINLDPVTLVTGQKYFAENTRLQKGITLGLGHIMQTRLAMLMASGTKKASIIKKTLEENISNAVPATFIRQHSHSLVLLDKDAAGLLSV